MEAVGIKEIKEPLELLKSVLSDAVEAKADGDVSTLEMIKIALSNAPAAVSAMMGLDVAVLQAQDIDKEEAKELAGLALEIGKLAMQLFSSSVA